MSIGYQRNDTRRLKRFGRGDKSDRAAFLAELQGMIDHLYNSPCVAVWVPFNESWGQFRANEVADWVKAYDPTRLVEHASGWFDQGGGDFQSRHVYFVHLAHGRGGAAAKSFGLRTALPLAAAYAGYHLRPNDVVCSSSSTVDGTADHGHCPRASITGMVTGFLVGSVAAIALDVKYLARYERAAPTWTAGVQPARGGVTVAISGSF